MTRILAVVQGRRKRRDRNTIETVLMYEELEAQLNEDCGVVYISNYRSNGRWGKTVVAAEIVA